jgi:hypothetical protein
MKQVRPREETRNVEPSQRLRLLHKPYEEQTVVLVLVHCPAQKCSSRGRECSKMAANSQNTLELKTEEWVSG